MRIDQTSTDGRSGNKPEILGRARRKTVTQRRARIDDLGADAGEFFIRQFSEPYGPEIVGVPSVLMAEIGPFAGRGAYRTSGAATRPPGQIVRQVEKIAGAVESLRQIFLQPQQFRRLH